VRPDELYQSPNRLAPLYSAFRVADRLLLTGHSHQAWPDCARDGQLRAWEEIAADLARPHPMNRLLEGDVGCGKTVVAFLAAVAVAESILRTAPEARLHVKRIVNERYGHVDRMSMDWSLFRGPEAREGMRAFAEKRAPQFRGR